MTKIHIFHNFRFIKILDGKNEHYNLIMFVLLSDSDMVISVTFTDFFLIELSTSH